VTASVTPRSYLPALEFTSYAESRENYARLWFDRGGTDFFGSPWWLSFLKTTFPQFPLSIAHLTWQGREVAMLPVMKTKRGMTALPLTPALGLICLDDSGSKVSAIVLLRDALSRENRRIRLRIRGSESSEDSRPGYVISVIEDLVACVAPNPRSTSGCPSGYRKNTWKQIRQAYDQGYESAVCNDIEVFWEFLSRTRQRQGTPMYPPTMKVALNQLVGNDGNANIRLVFNGQGEPLSAILLLEDSRRTTYAFGANAETADARKGPANTLLMHEALLAASRRVKIFDFGLSPLVNAGLLQFKEGFGASRTYAPEMRSPYSHQELSRSSSLVRFSTQLMPRLPSQVYRSVTSRIFPFLV